MFSQYLSQLRLGKERVACAWTTTSQSATTYAFDWWLFEQRFIAPMLFEGTCNTEMFNQWLLHMLLPLLLTGSVIVMDNATLHKSERTAQIIADAGCQLLFLAPYSPDLNPIEKLWGNIKRQWRYASHLTIDEFLESSDYLVEYSYI